MNENYKGLKNQNGEVRMRNIFKFNKIKPSKLQAWAAGIGLLTAIVVLFQQLIKLASDILNLL